MEQRPTVTRCLAEIAAGAALAAVAALAAILTITILFSRTDRADASPSTGASPLRIVVLGDSYASGEGAASFFAGTDRRGANKCRRSSSAYPYLLADLIEPPEGYDGVSLLSVACSGARTTNVIPFEGVDCTLALFPDGCPSPQSKESPEGQPEAAYQIEALGPGTDLAIVQIGAGDAQLIDAMAACAASRRSCAAAVEVWSSGMPEFLTWRLAEVFRAARRTAPDAVIVAVGYPSLLFTGACPATRLDQEETDAITTRLVPALNEAIRAAASAAGIVYADIESALGGRQICRPAAPGGSPPAAVTGIQIRPIRSISLELSSWFHGSLHPNGDGHRLIAERIAGELEIPPRTERREAVPSPPSDAPEPFAAGPAGTSLYANDSPCGTRSVRHETLARPVRPVVELTGVDDGTTVCHRALGAGWRTAGAEDGVLEVPLSDSDRDGFGAWNEILYRSNAAWVRLTVVAPAGPDSASESFARAWPWRWVRSTADVLLEPVILLTLIVLAAAGRVMWCTRRRTPEPPRRTAPGRTMASRGRRR